MIPSMFRKAMVGDGSTLNLDFTTMTATADLTARGLTFTRSSNGTRINASGFVETMSNNVARFDHDSTTRAPRGLLIEGQATNLVTQSNGATSVWTIGGHRTPTNNTTDLVSPDGTNNATKLVCGTAGNYSSFATSITGLTGGGTYTVSYWIRGPVGHTPRLYAVNGTVGDVTPTATTGTYNNTGWTRLTQTYTLPAATTQVYVYFMSVTIVVTGDTFYVYGFQLETGSGASSLIPTGASQATRVQDQMEMADISALSYNLSVGTVAITAFWNKNASSAFPRSIRFVDASNVISSSIITTTDDLLGNWPLANGTTTLETTSANVPPLARFKYAMSASAVANPTLATLDVALNGTTGNTTGVASTVRPATKLQFLYGAVATTDYPSMTISSLKYWPTLMTSAQLQAMTTL